jgi:hypothetical protein
MVRDHYYPAKAAVAGQHVSSEVWDDEYHGDPIDELDAQVVEHFVCHNLPVHLCRAVRYHYTGRPKHIGIPDRVILEWVEQAARQLQAKRFHVV